MKKCMRMSLMAALCLGLVGCGGQEAGEKSGPGAWPVILILLGLLLLAFALLRTWNYVQYCQRQRRRGRRQPKGLDMMTWCVYVLAGALVILGLLLGIIGGGGPGETTADSTGETTGTTTIHPV